MEFVLVLLLIKYLLREQLAARPRLRVALTTVVVLYVVAGLTAIIVWRRNEEQRPSTTAAANIGSHVPLLHVIAIPLILWALLYLLTHDDHFTG